MKHINDPMPDVQIERPETSAALAQAVERATAKDPKHRYGDMNEFLYDLEGALEVEVSRAGRSTGEATTVLDSVPRKQRALPSRRRMSVFGVALVVLAAAAAIAFAALSGSDEHADEEGRARGDRHGADRDRGSGGVRPAGRPGASTTMRRIEAIDDEPDSTGWITESVRRPASRAHRRPGSA